MANAKRLWPLASFLALIFAVSCGWTFRLAAADDVIEKGVGWPTHFPALLGPAFAAIVVTALIWGRPGVRDLLGRRSFWQIYRTAAYRRSASYLSP